MKFKKLDNSGITHVFLGMFVVLAVAIAGVFMLVASHADTPTLMYDSADPRKIPSNAKVVASYVGSQVGYKLAKQKFPKAILISINETPSSNDSADIWGIEPGAKTISQTIDAIANGKAHGAYGLQSDLDAVKKGLNAKGISRDSYVLWLSGAGTQNYTHIPPGDDAHQFKYVAGQYDVSTISPKFLSTLGKGGKASKSTKPPSSSPAKNHGQITFVTQEQIISPTGKKSTVRKGNVKVQLVSASANTKCRHFKDRLTSVKLANNRYQVYIGHGDTAKNSNQGKIHLQSCSTGVYRIVPQPSANQELVSVTSPITVKKGKTSNVVVTVRTKAGATPAPIPTTAANGTPTGATAPVEVPVEDTPQETVPVDPNNPDEGIGTDDPAANTDPGQ